MTYNTTINKKWTKQDEKKNSRFTAVSLPNYKTILLLKKILNDTVWCTLKLDIKILNLGSSSLRIIYLHSFRSFIFPFLEFISNQDIFHQFPEESITVTKNSWSQDIAIFVLRQTCIIFICLLSVKKIVVYIPLCMYTPKVL